MSEVSLPASASGGTLRWVLLPGLDGSGRLFRWLVDCLPDGVQPVVVTYPASEPASHSDLVRIIQAHLPDEPFVLIAESFSGPLALRVASVAAVKPVAIVLCASFVSSPIGQRLAKVAALCSPVLRAVNIPTWLIRRYLVGNAKQEQIEAFRSSLRSLSPTAMKSRFEVLNELRGESGPPRLSLPILYLRATRDRLVGAEDARNVLLHYPQAEIHEIEAPHFALQTAPEEAIRLIDDFLRRLR